MTRTLAGDIAFQARLRPHALAVFGAGGPVSFRRLAREIDGLATDLLVRGLARTDLVGILMGSSYLHLLLILALDRLSIPSLSFVLPEAPPAAVVRDDFGVTAIAANAPAPADPPCRWIAMAEPHRPAVGAPDAARLSGVDSPPDALIRVGWSSGTTGGPKGTPQTRALLMRRFQRLQLLRNFGPHVRYLSALPFSAQPHSMLAVLACGGAVILPDPSVDFITRANTLGATATTVSPALLSRLVELARGSGRRLETMESLDVAGAHLPSQLAREARCHLTPNLSISYGTSETGRIATADAAVCVADAGAVGHLSPWAECQIVDEADRPVPTGQEGFLRARTDEMPTGYVRNPAASRRNFRDGWFYPGDRGAITADGMLRITGRVEDLIRHAGALVSPLPLEEIMRALPGVRDVAVFAVAAPDGSERTCAAVVLDGGADLDAIAAGARATLGDRAPTRLLPIASLPRNAAGKVMRRELVLWKLRGAPR